MRHAGFESQTCSIARALEVIGEWWTLLIVREAFFGTQRFTDFEKNLGIAKNVLAERLRKLVAAGVMRREAVAARGNPQLYQLTEKGRDLLPIAIALMQWGDQWISGRGQAPVRVRERTTQHEIGPLVVRNKRGRPLMLDDVEVVPGPGASDAIRRRFGPAARVRR